MIFILSTLAFIAVGAYGLRNGSPKRLTYPYDPDGKACGLDSGYENAKFLYFPVPNINFVGRSVCVEACPTLTSITTCSANDGTALTGAKWNAKVVSATPSKICPAIITDLFPTFDKTNAAKVT